MSARPSSRIFCAPAMSVINLLTPHVADLIAAGEVVERPASVIKELVENSFDAGAKNVTVEIRNGGATYIRVTDDGCGMAPEDVGIAFLRHATSKLKDESGLDSISTMGFRGEALAAISSVSRMEITTRLKGSSTGTFLSLEAGEIDDMTETGCPEGTTVVCLNLFYNTPARLKFMKSDRSESSACINAALRCALGRPDVSVRFIRDGSEEFFTPGDGRLDSCIYSLLGRDESRGMLSCTSSSGSLKLSGFVSSPSECRGNRAHQYFFVNGRNIKSATLQTALEQAYRNSLLVGKYPSCVLYLELPFTDVDVNVHPAKTEVRFGKEREVFDFVFQSVKLALEGEQRIYSETKNAPLEPVCDVKTPVVSEEKKEPWIFHRSEMDYGTQMTIRHFEQNFEEPKKSAISDRQTEEIVEKVVQNVESPHIPEHNILGQVFKTYIIVEQNGEILLIDKHAAHERMVFDRLMLENREISSQMLLTPVTMHLSGEEADILESNGELIGNLGFEIEPFGEREYIVRSVPSDLDPFQTTSAVEEILDKLRCGISPDDRGEILKTVACKAAIKAGWDTSDLELKKIVGKVVSGEIKYCPHGRPVSVVITRQDLDKLFKRIV